MLCMQCVQKKLFQIMLKNIRLCKRRLFVRLNLCCDKQMREIIQRGQNSFSKRFAIKCRPARNNRVDIIDHVFDVLASSVAVDLVHHFKGRAVARPSGYKFQASAFSGGSGDGGHSSRRRPTAGRSRRGSRARRGSGCSSSRRAGGRALRRRNSSIRSPVSCRSEEA